MAVYGYTVSIEAYHKIVYVGTGPYGTYPADTQRTALPLTKMAAIWQASIF